MDDVVQKLRSQIGDDVAAIYDHGQLFRMAADEIERLRARAEAAEAAWDGMRAQAETAGAELSESRIRWRDALDMLEARWSKREARREVAHQQEIDALRSELIGWRERAKKAEARAAISGGDDA